MFKFIKQYVETIQGIDIYPIISLFIFVLFFIAVLWYVTKMDKRKVEEIKHLPLDLDDDNSYVNSIKQA
ncbi:MAG: CcoQ/FixQ family Cbb3-type cytochrome c oxidase assembly chaperone [Flavisolibacter sp.]